MNISQLLKTLKDSTVTLSMGEALVAGVSVALISMSVVFIVLLVITAIIKLLQSEKLQKETTIESKEVKKDESIEELVSVITAAIAASTGNSTNNIIVRKISRTNNSKTNWERMTKNTTK